MTEPREKGGRLRGTSGRAMPRDVGRGARLTRRAGEYPSIPIGARTYGSVWRESNDSGVRLARTPTIRECGGVVTARPHQTRVLVLARESVLAALIGMLLELEDYDPVFAEPGERPEDAIRRLRPPLIVMLDGEIDAASSDLFYARAAASGARVVLFSEPVAADQDRKSTRLNSSHLVISY